MSFPSSWSHSWTRRKMTVIRCAWFNQIAGEIDTIQYLMTKGRLTRSATLGAAFVRIKRTLVSLSVSCFSLSLSARKSIAIGTLLMLLMYVSYRPVPSPFKMITHTFFFFFFFFFFLFQCQTLSMRWSSTLYRSVLLVRIGLFGHCQTSLSSSQDRRIVTLGLIRFCSSADRVSRLGFIAFFFIRFFFSTQKSTFLLLVFSINWYSSNWNIWFASLFKPNRLDCFAALL